MTHSDRNSQLSFDFEGQFLGFGHHDGTLKYLRLKVLSEEIQVKLPKAMRAAEELPFQRGDSLRITGSGKLDRQTHKLKLKAAQITPLPLCSPIEPSTSANLPTATTQRSKLKPNIKVLVCQKSGCLKRGGKGLCKALDQILRDRHLQPYVTIKPTGCLKRCSAAPNLVIQPGNQRYTDVRPKSLPQIATAIAQCLVLH